MGMGKVAAEKKIREGVTWGELRKLIESADLEGQSHLNPGLTRAQIHEIFSGACGKYDDNKRVGPGITEYLVARNILREYGPIIVEIVLD